MFIQTRGPLAACLLSDYVLYILFVDNLEEPWSSGAWGPGPNGPVVDPPLVMTRSNMAAVLHDEHPVVVFYI